jgi:hypothetical protein
MTMVAGKEIFRDGQMLLVDDRALVSQLAVIRQKLEDAAAEDRR